MRKSFRKNANWIFFDLDDTLIPSSEAYITAYNKMFLKNDTAFTEAKKYVKDLLPRNHTSAHNRFLYFKKYLEFKNKFSTQLLFKVNLKYEMLLQAELNKYVKNSPLVKQLKELKKNYNLAVITNENCRTQMIKINCIDPNGKIFDRIITSEEVGVEKPHKNIFKEALKICQTKPSKVIFIGDSYTNDYIPAMKLGMTAYLILQFKDEPFGLKNNINTLSSIKEFINL